MAGAFFMEMLDGTVIATALPQMGRAFHVSAVEMNLGITAYVLATAACVPISGWVADRFGPRLVFAGALSIFTLASLFCGLCQGLPSFVVFRVLQGIGGAAMVPVGRLVVLRVTPKPELMAAIATIVWPGLVAPVLGPALGGLLVTYVSWRWIFFLNLPLGIVAVALTTMLISNDRLPQPRPLDLVGFLLSGAALTLLVGGLDGLGHQHGAPLGAGCVIAGLGLGALGILHLRRHPTPLLDLSPMRLPTYALGIWGGSLLRIAIGSAPFLLPLLFQTAFGLDALQSGLLVLCVFAGNLVMKLRTTAVLRRFGFRNVLLVNGLLNCASLGACALLTPETPKLAIAAVLFAGGLCRSMQFTSLSSLQFVDVPERQMSGANTLASMVSQLTMGAGVVFGALALNLSALARGRPAGTPDLADFRTAFLVFAVLALFGLIDSFRLAPSAGRLVSGHEPA